MASVVIGRGGVGGVQEQIKAPPNSDMTIAYIGLGSNLAKPLSQLNSACEALSALTGVTVLAVSPLYQSPALPVPGASETQPDYLNAVAKVDTALTAAELLNELHKIEARQGRERKAHWAARTLDLDLLLYGDEQNSAPELLLPHPRIHERRFVLQPLLDLAPSLLVPGQGAVEALLKNCASDPINQLSQTLMLGSSVSKQS